MINNYKLGKTLGTGFTSDVYLATDQTTGSECALKVFKLNQNLAKQ